MDASLPIGMFDSGVGGLTVLKAVHNLLPNENLIYLGDTARVPYGTKSANTIEKYTLNAASRLIAYGIKMLVIACNTATSAALPALSQKLAPIPVIGVIEPGAKAAVEASSNSCIAVIATEATVRGKAYVKAISAILPQARIISKACTLFVSLAEEGWHSGEIAEAVSRKYLQDIFTSANSPDTLLLGCTHFPLLLDTLQKVVGENIQIVDSARATAEEVKRELEKRNFCNNGLHSSSRFLTTDNPERFARSGALFLGENIPHSAIELVDL